MIICYAPECQQVLSFKGIEDHLLRKHQLQRHVRQELSKFLADWQWPYDFRTVPLPLDGSLPQPVIPIVPGFQCQDCDFKTPNRQIIRKHSNQKHNKKGVKDNKIYRLVQLQTWFTAKRARYWVVSRATATSSGIVQEEEEGNLEVRGSGSDSLDPSAIIKTEVTTWIKKEEEEERYHISTIAAETDPWLRYTGWDAELGGSEHDLVTIASFAATATAAEPELEPVLLSWERIFQRCLHTLTATGNYKDILKWWASPKQEAVHQRPFEPLEKPSIVRYSQTFVRLICYVIRTTPESYNDETATGITFT